MCDFTFSHYREIFETALQNGYQIIPVRDYITGNYAAHRKILINRIDIDYKIGRVKDQGQIFKSLHIAGSFYFRLHGPYNLFEFKHINLVKWLISHGHEIGVHSEIVDMQNICNTEPSELLKTEITVFERMFGCEISGVASHGDMTGYNNLDFWKDHKPADFNLLYEAYDDVLWKQTRYVSDSEFTRWKAYQNGTLIEGDRRCVCHHIREGVPVIYLLTHPISWYWEHFHE